MKPALSPQTTGFLPSACTSSATSSSTSGAVTTVCTISTKPCTGAGLKKCTPITRPGCEVAEEISVTESEEVLVARIVSSETMPSSCLKMSFLTSTDSTTASTTRSASLSSSSEVVNAHPAVQLLLVLLGQLAAGDRASRRVLDVLPAAVDAVIVDLHAHDGVPMTGEHLRDPGTHGAQSDNADGLEVTCHGPHPATAPGAADCVSAHGNSPLARSVAVSLLTAKLLRTAVHRRTPSPSRLTAG